MSDAPHPERHALGVSIQTLAGIAPPISIDDIGAVLGVDSDAIVESVEQLEADGRVRSDRVGISAEAVAGSPTRVAVLARRLADHLEATSDTPQRRASAYWHAGKSSQAFAAYREALAASGRPPGTEGNLLDRAIASGREAGVSGSVLAPLLVQRSRLRRNRGETRSALTDLSEATPHLEGESLVDGLAFLGALQDDLQLPADAERSIAMAMLVAGEAQADAKLGSLLTLQARMLTRLGFEHEADASLERGRLLVEMHGTEVQEFYTTVNTAWIDLDRGRVRDAERGFTLAKQRAGDVEGEVSVANQSAYLARALFAAGDASRAIEEVARARDLAETRAVDFISTIAEIEGALAFHRPAEAAAGVGRLNEIVASSFPAWSNRAATLAARSALESGHAAEARTIAERALGDSPIGQNGHRLRVELEAIRLVAADPWDAERAADLSDLMLQSGWHGLAAWFLVKRSDRDKAPTLGLQAAALAHRLGMIPLAIDAVDAANAWGDHDTDVIRLSARTIGTQIPADWREGWLEVPGVSSALDDSDLENADPSALALTLESALDAAGLAGFDDVLSPAQRRAIGLVPKPRAATATAVRGLALVVGMFIIAALTALTLRPDPVVPVALEATPPTEVATPQEPEIPIRDRVVESEGSLAGQSPFAGGETRNAVVPGGFREPTGVYWERQLTGFISADPVLRGSALYVGTSRGRIYSIDINRSSDIFAESGASAFESSATEGLVAGFLEGGQSESIVYFADEAGSLQARAIDSVGETFWQIDLGGSPGGPPLVDGTRVIIGSDGGFILALDAVTGAELARYPAVEPISGGFPHPLVRDDGVIYATTGAGTIALLSDDDLSLICEVDLGSAKVTTHPVVHDGSFFFGSSVGSVVVRSAGGCGAPSGVPAFLIGTPVLFPPVFVDDVMFVVSDELVLPLTIAANEFAYTSIQVGGGVTGPPIIAGDLLIVANEFGDLLAFDTADGSEVWRFQVGSVVETRPAIGENVIIVATARGDIIAIAGN